LYGLVKEHLSDFLQYARESYAGPLPRYVVNEFRHYLSCGDFGRGFVLLRCRSCSHHLAVAFSCKLRSVCPSCAGRRMAGEAALLVDRLLPAQPMRQYVLAFPYELSGLAATRPEVLTFLSRAFWDALRVRYRQWAKRTGVAKASLADTGAVTGVHRGGSSLNLHVHFHVLCLDGVYMPPEEDVAPRFVEAPAPTRQELESMLQRIYGRVMKWLKKRGLLRDEEDSHERPALSAQEELTLAGLQRGTLVTLRSDVDEPDEVAPAAPPPPPKSDAVVFERFNLHASTRLSAEDDVGRERLCRYLTRPVFALGRIRRLRDGNVAYRVKKVSRHRVTERVMSPVEFLGRLASLIAPPRYPLLRLHGVFAARHAWRARVVPKPPAPQTGRKQARRVDESCPCCKTKGGPHHETKPTPATERPSAPRPSSPPAEGNGRTAFVQPASVPTAALVASGHAQRIAPNILSVAHWDRIEQGALYAATSRLDWISLLRRTFDVDLRVCARCGGPLSIRSVISAPEDVDRILTALRRPRAPPRV
jgi:hypothetical protein